MRGPGKEALEQAAEIKHAVLQETIARDAAIAEVHRNHDEVLASAGESCETERESARQNIPSTTHLSSDTVNVTRTALNQFRTTGVPAISIVRTLAWFGRSKRKRLRRESTPETCSRFQPCHQELPRAGARADQIEQGARERATENEQLKRNFASKTRCHY